MDIELLQMAIDKWGREVQMNKIQEEALELSLILNQMKCPTKNKEELEINLYSELADMKIMMAQADLLFDKERIDTIVKLKLERLRVNYFSNSQ